MERTKGQVVEITSRKYINAKMKDFRQDVEGKITLCIFLAEKM